VDVDRILADHVAELCDAMSSIVDEGGEVEADASVGVPRITRRVLEERAVAVTASIGNVDTRVSSTLRVLRAASVPYCDAVQQLSEDAMRWPGQRLQEVRADCTATLSHAPAYFPITTPSLPLPRSLPLSPSYGDD
jgi:hypothetical protein